MYCNGPITSNESTSAAKLEMRVSTSLARTAAAEVSTCWRISSSAVMNLPLIRSAHPLRKNQHTADLRAARRHAKYVAVLKRSVKVRVELFDELCVQRKCLH